MALDAFFSPLSLAIYLVIVLGFLLLYKRQRGQWERHQVALRDRARELAALVAAACAMLALVALGSLYLNDRALETRMLAELAQRTAAAQDLQQQIKAQLDNARVLLADRAAEKVGAQKLVEARAELARFAAFRDARIIQMIALIDTELEIRSLLQRAREENAPKALALLYKRLAELVPGNTEYRDKAAQYAASPN